MCLEEFHEILQSTSFCKKNNIHNWKWKLVVGRSIGIPSRSRIRIGLQHGGSIFQQTGSSFDAVQRSWHILLKDGVIAAMDSLLANLYIAKGSIFDNLSLRHTKQNRADLNEIGDGNRNCVHRPLQIRHGVAIFGLFM